MKRSIIIICSVIFFLGIFIFFRKNDHESEDMYAQEVTLYHVTRTSDAIEHVFGATVKPVNEAVLSAEISGSVESMYVMEGEEVKKGQLIAQIDAGEYAARYTQAQKMVAIAQEEEKLARRKWDDYKPEERERIKLEVDRAQAQSAEALAHLSKSRITAPFDGVISTKFVQTGDTVSQGERIIRVVGEEDKTEVAFDVVSEIAKQLAISDKIQLAHGDKAVTAHIYAIDPIADARTRKSTVYAKIDNSDVFVVGDFVNVHIETSGDVNGSVVPIGSLVHFYDDTIVFVVENDRVRMTVVDVISAEASHAVVSGIDVGQRVVVSGAHLLRDGDRIRVLDQ